MKKIFNDKILNFIETTIFILLFAKFLSLIMWWYLPDSGVEEKEKISVVMPYQRIDFKNMLVHISIKKEIKKNVHKKDIATNINELILKGVYGNEKYGYIIIATKKNPNKTSIISIGETYKGYKLKSIHLDYVIFTKNGKNYILRFKQTKKQIMRVTHFSLKKSDKEKMVSRRDINYYTTHFYDIWKDISIDEIKKNGHIEGFLIKRIRPGSKMAKLGLKKGDIILKVNNIKLSSYSDVMNIYNNIKYIETLDLLIKRGNKEKEITYEIY